jgi:hypothetical protein
MTPESTSLLADVVACIVESGYAELPRQRRGYNVRPAQIEVLAHDPRIDARAWSSEMLDEVMTTYNVKRSIARHMLHEARKQRREAIDTDAAK